MLVRLAIVLALAVAFSACGSDSGEGEERAVEPEPAEPVESAEPGVGQEGDLYPSVVQVSAERTGRRTFTLSVTIDSPYDSPERYADGWRVLTPEGETIAEHELQHDHANEQPFTREQPDVEVPGGVTEVIVEARDSANGYGGKTGIVALTRGG